MMMAFAQKVNTYLWDYILLILLVGGGVWFTFLLRFVQVRGFGKSFKAVFGNIKLKGDAAGDDGMSSFQSLATAIAAQVGTGNIAGAATAIVSGGPGAILWMWVSAFFGMSTIFAEATMAQKHKTVVDGAVTGGPVYYIKAAFKGKVGKILAALFAFFIIIALGFMGNAVQSNSIGDAFHTAFGLHPALVGLVVAILAFVVFRGGVRRIASVVEKLVPLMALLYMIFCAIILVNRASMIGEAFKMIFVGAFTPQAVLGGVLGVTVKQALRYGISRGLFSNEAGMGSTPHAHAIARVKHPCEQGMVAMMGVFIDTFIVLTLTALTILTTGVLDGTVSGIPLTQAAFSSVLGKFGEVVIAVCLLFFAFSTIISWYFFAEANIRYLFGKKIVPIFSLLVCICIWGGSIMSLELVWELADMFNGFMVIPNMLGLFGLSFAVRKLYKEYESGLWDAGKSDSPSVE